jgi:hypothetical protein
MNDAYYTQTGERPDLAAIEVNPPEGYIGSMLVPTFPVSEKSGYLFYATVTSDGTAETDRSAGSGPDSTQISDSSTTFTAAEAAYRGKITPDEVKLMGGIEKADKVGGIFVKRSVMKARETAICTATLGVTASDTFDPAKFFEVAQTALDSIRRYAGKRVLYGSTMALKKAVQGILADGTFGPVLARAISGTSPQVAAQGFNFKAWMDALAMLTGVDQVLAGDSSIWNATAVADRIGFMAADQSGDPLAHKYEPVFGRVVQFMPDGTNEVVIQSIADRVNVNNLYDAYTWYSVKTLNSAANYVIDGVQG